MPAELYICLHCGAPKLGLHMENKPCITCNEGILTKIPYTSGYDRPHVIVSWVRAPSLERVAGAPSAIELLHQVCREADANDADWLRDLLAVATHRLAELDTQGAYMLEDELDQFGEVKLTPFKKDADGEWPPDTLYLFELEDDAGFCDDDDRTFTKLGYGPVQGTVEVEDDEGTHSYLDVTTRVQPN